MVGLADVEFAVAPGEDRAGPDAVLIDQADVLLNVQVLMLRLEDHLVLIHLADLGAHRLLHEVPLAASQLVAAEIGVEAALALVLGFALIEAVIPSPVSS